MSSFNPAMPLKPPPMCIGAEEGEMIQKMEPDSAHRVDSSNEAPPAADAPPDEWGRVSRIECRSCGHEPPEQDMAKRQRCPKCLASSWIRVVRFDSLQSRGPRNKHASSEFRMRL
jgi:hypothetical protein